MGSRGSDFKLPSVPNKVAMGGMKGLPGMPGSKGGSPSQSGVRPPPRIGGAFQSNMGAGYNKPGAPSGLGAFNVPKYG